MTIISSQEFEAYLPSFDAIPEEWELARAALTEYLKKISNAVNAREIGWWLDVELLSGKQFYPGSSNQANAFRSMFRIVVDCSPLVPGVNTFAHGIPIDGNFSLVQLYAGATNPSLHTAEPIPNGSDTITMDATNIYITVAANWARAFSTVEYIFEL
jgi:hypothetical protein